MNSLVSRYVVNLLAMMDQKISPPYIQEGDLPELVKSCGIELFWHKAALSKSPEPGFQLLLPQCL